MSTVVETQSVAIVVTVNQGLCIETIERAILDHFPVQTNLLRWAIVGQTKPVSNEMVGYCIEATLQRIV
jgi:hypothetical protein